MDVTTPLKLTARSSLSLLNFKTKVQPQFLNYFKSGKNSIVSGSTQLNNDEAASTFNLLMRPPNTNPV